MKLLPYLAIASALVACTTNREVAPTESEAMRTVGNPYLPLWEHIPDGEPYVFDDPDRPGRQRVYIYGSHDSRLTDYCGRELVVWSAPVDSLNRWRYDGEIFVVNKNAKGEALYPDSIKGDVIFAPDVALKIEADGSKTYYLYPNDMAGGRQNAVAKSKSPKGPFEICNWSHDDPNSTVGPFGFDPGVFVDDDGRAYGYWGFGRSYAAELDTATMATVKPGTTIIEDMVSGMNQPGIFHFFEASSIRKVDDKYVFIYSRFAPEGEWGMHRTNYTLAYAYSDHPLGPWTYGGTIIDGRARETDEQGRPIASATVDGNTHGSICCINGQWYVFYHRQTGYDEYARQAMVAPITVRVEQGPGGKVFISEGEVTSEGFATDGLDPLEPHSAAICCWHTGPKPTLHGNPKTYFGSFIDRGYGTADRFEHPYALRNNTNPVVNNTDGSIVGYKYFNMNALNGASTVMLHLHLIPQGTSGTIRIMIDRPWISQGGQEVGCITLTADSPQTPTVVDASVDALASLTGKHALYFVFSSPTSKQSLCTLLDFVFSRP